MLGGDAMAFFLFLPNGWSKTGIFVISKSWRGLRPGYSEDWKSPFFGGGEQAI